MLCESTGLEVQRLDLQTINELIAPTHLYEGRGSGLEAAQRAGMRSIDVRILWSN
jgi:hypothetical protein